MQTASADLISLLANPQRDFPAHLRVTFGIIDPTVQQLAVATATSQTSFSDVRDIMAGVEYLNDYHTLERNSIVLGRGGSVLPDSGWRKTGLTSSVVSRADRTFATNPKIIITSTGAHSTIGTTLRFDTFRNEWCDFILRGYYDSELINTYYSVVDNVDYSINAPLDEWNKLEIEFTRTKIPYRRARISTLTFGMYRVDRVITGTAKHVTEVSPISDKLPTESFTWTLLNFDQSFQPGQKTGIQRFIMEQQPVMFEWGYPIPWEDLYTYDDEEIVTADEPELTLSSRVTDITEENVEWVLAANYWTTGRPQFARNTITLQATGLLTYLTDIYYKGLYRPAGISLYDLAEEVLLAANLTLKPDGSHRWRLWEGLKDFRTTAPLPKKPMRELLQLIANCGGCVFLPDREGDIVIGPKPVDESEGAGQLGTFRLNGVLI